MNQKSKDKINIHTQKFALSNKFEELSVFDLKASQELEQIANNHLDAIIASFQIIKFNYDDWRSEYNATRPTNERVFLTPYLRIVDGVRRNIYIVWIRICSESYLGKLNTGAPWQPREIKRNGKQHYNKQILKSALSSYTKNCLPHLLDVEHSLVYLREQLAIATSLFETSRTIKPRGFGLLLAQKQLEGLSEAEDELLEKLESELIYLKAEADPLALPKKLAKIKFES